MIFKKPIIRFIFVLIIPLILSGCILYSTGSTEIGIRTKKFAFFSPRGVEDKIYPPGATYFFLPIINDWNTFDTKLQNIEMTLTKGRGDIYGRDDLLFKTIDGNDISLDVIISYRIIREKAPYILQNIASSDKVLRTKIVRIVARSRPRDIFGELTTEEFYNAEQRAAKSEKAKVALNQILNPYGILVERVLTKDYRFNENYQKAIENKKLADQKTEQNKSATRAKVEEYNRKFQEAKAEVNKMVAISDGNFQKAKIKADAYYSQQKKIASAIIAEGRAEAKGIKKLNQALAGTGGNTMVKLKIADSLKNKKILLIPTNSGLNLKTMDLNKLLNVYGIQKLAEKKKPQKKLQTPKQEEE